VVPLVVVASALSRAEPAEMTEASALSRAEPAEMTEEIVLNIVSFLLQEENEN
jgi:hypothetical protein